MPGIGETLRHERRRQGRTLADAAAETRVRESYLAAIEEDDFEVLGGDVYARGFIRLYGKYLSLDADALVAEYRRNHEKPEEVSAIPGATFDDFSLPSRNSPRRLVTQPVMAALAIVGVLVVAFLFFRGGDEPTDDESVDPNAPGPAPVESAEASDLALDDSLEDPAADDPAVDASAPDPSPSPAGEGAADEAQAPDGTTPLDGEVLEDVTITVEAIEAVRLTVTRGQPPVSGALLEPGEARTLSDPDGQQVVFTISNFTGAEITVNGGTLVNPDFEGQAVQISCTVGETACNATPL